VFPDAADRAFRVVLYTETTSLGGAEVSLRNLIAALDPALDLVVMGVDRSICEWLVTPRPSTPIVVVPPVRNKASVGAFAAHRREIARLAPCVFHANLRTMGDAQYALVAALSVRGVATVAAEQLPLSPPTRLSLWLKRMTSTRLSRHVAVGERAARIVEEAVGLPDGSVGTIYNGVPDLGPPAATAPRARPLVGTLARLDPIKGLDLLLDVMAELPGADLVIAGEGPERDALVAQAARLGIADRCRLLPWSDDARAMLPTLDVFVLPSRNEGFPLSIVEAMLAERPVVASDVGSVAEAVVDGETGFVVPPDDSPALRAALADLLADEALRRRMGAAGRTRALAGFTSEVMARRFEDVYEQITGRPILRSAQAEVAAPPAPVAPATPTAAHAATPTFSVIIPAYQSAAVIGDAIASVLAQTAPPEEVIVVDDGSTDDLAGAVAAASGEDEARVRIVRIEHAGESAARNAGLAAATSDFVAMLDADDRYEPGFLAAIGSLAASRPDLDVLTADAVFDAGDGSRGTFYDANLFPVVDQRAAILRSCFLTTLSAVRTEPARATGFDPRLLQGGDWDFWIRLILAGSRVGLVRQPLTRYRIHPGQASARRAHSLAARVTVLEKALRSGDLRATERQSVEASLPPFRARAAAAAAREAATSKEARATWWAAARDGKQPVRLRAAGLVGALWPGGARRLAGRL
jgi:glycosyltransferase involved in cell wall biosynthesis